ncbi:MAG: hypothetical protein ACRDF8_05310 [Chloroflexota bacterium]
MPAGMVPRRRHEPYQAYLKASLVVAITAGWLLGAVELCAITFHGAFQGVASRLINPALFEVHGQSQIIGWVGLFIMGIAYQVIPRQRRVALHAPGVSYVVLALMLSGIALRAVAQPLAGGSHLFGGLTVLSAALELAGVSVFMGGIIKGRVMADSIQGPERFSRAALQWFGVALVVNLAATIYLAAQGSAVLPDWLDRGLLIVELFGFITMMIFGVNARNLPLFMAVKPVAPDALRPVLRLLPAAVVAAAGGEVVSTLSGQASQALRLAGWAGILVAALLYVDRVGLVRPRQRRILTAGHSGWYEAYVLAAYSWLVVGLAIELGTAAAQAAGIPTPAGDLFLAGLHAITVGFISTMIMGMAARIVPAFAATRLYSGRLLTATWCCLMLGTALRVPTQALYSTAGGVVVPLLGLSGVIQLAALVLFAINLWLTLNASPAGQQALDPGSRHAVPVGLRPA